MNNLPHELTIRGKFTHVRTDSGCVLYVVEFSNGVVKIGRSQRARSRLSGVATFARELFGPVYVTNVHVTKPCKNKQFVLGGEYRAIKTLEQIGEPISGCAEYFKGVEFSRAAAIADESLAECISSHRSFLRSVRRRERLSA